MSLQYCLLKHQYNQILTLVPKPFVKWAGGKRQLLPILTHHMPKKYNSYFEPFLGGGALLFHLLSENPRQKCYMSDLNSDLILAYVTIRDKVGELITLLKCHSDNYFKNPKSYYYSMRKDNPKDQIEKVSRFIFLNRTCFNGLYRVNSKGKFNVPIGRYAKPNIVNMENLFAVSSALQSSKILIKCQDFSAIIDHTEKNDFIYLDPPYQPISSTANFTSYTHCDFGYDEQKRLLDFMKKLDEKGCKVMLSNSKSKEVVDLFSPLCTNIIEVDANRNINSDSKKRKGHSELLIKNY